MVAIVSVVLEFIGQYLVVSEFTLFVLDVGALFEVIRAVWAINLDFDEVGTCPFEFVQKPDKCPP